MLSIALLSLSVPTPTVSPTAVHQHDHVIQAHQTQSAIVSDADADTVASLVAKKVKSMGSCYVGDYKVCDCTCSFTGSHAILTEDKCEELKEEFKSFDTKIRPILACDRVSDCNDAFEKAGGTLNNMVAKCSGGYGGGGGGCFAKDSTTACLLASPTAECEHILMADLVPGDLVLGRDGATTVVAVQHKAVDTPAEMLTFHTADGPLVSMTPDHAVFVDGALVAAADAKVGSTLSTGIVTSITKGTANIINAVTASGTIVADGVVAASNPMWIASLTVDAPLTRAAVNAVLYAVGDVDSVAAGCAKVAATLAGAVLSVKALRSRKPSA